MHGTRSRSCTEEAWAPCSRVGWGTPDLTLGHRTPAAALPPSASTTSLLHKRANPEKKLRNGNKETSQRSSTMEPALPRAHKEEAQGSGQLQLYKVTQIFYLETAKPILISSISINNPTGCCNLAYKQREV